MSLQQSSNLFTYRRARPALGTIAAVEVTAHSETLALQAIEAGFSAIDSVERRLSFFKPSSVVSAFNALPIDSLVEMTPSEVSMLELAIDLFRRSSGAFSPFVEPGSKKRLRGIVGPPFTIEGLFVRKTREVALELGGIAKGFAVDAAIAAMTADGQALSALVNAGGDIRASGLQSYEVKIRSPSDANRAALSVTVCDEALASSSFFETPGFEFSGLPETSVRGLLAPARPAGVAVIAPSCCVADALTKIFSWGSPVDAEALLERYNARALLLE